MRPDATLPRSVPSRLGAATALHAFTWLAVANTLGVGLALLLVAPSWGDRLGPLTWGRWAPLHFDLHFYGWVLVPVLGALLLFLSPSGEDGRLGAVALAGWSAALAVSACDGLGGHSSGKVFLEWTGVGRVAVALGCAGLVTAGGWLVVRGWRQRHLESRATLIVRSLVVAGSVLVPLVLLQATAPEVYPAINPRSGGATHANTAASVLGVVAVLLATPVLLRMRARDGGRRRWGLAGLLAVHLAALAALGGGDRSHTEPAQWLALGSTAVWLPLLAWATRAERWPAAARGWLSAAAGWGTVTLVTGLIGGWPGMAERWKFTNALVGHVHAAVAGLVTSWLMAMLLVLHDEEELTRSLAHRAARGLWHGSLGVHVAALVWLGTLEGGLPGLVASADAAPAVTSAYLLRLGSGLVMATLSWWWWWMARRSWAGLRASRPRAPQAPVPVTARSPEVVA